MFPTDHVPNKATFGVQIGTDSDTNVLFTADAKPLSQARYDWADVIFHDCSFSPKYPATVHTHFEELCKLPEETRAKIRLMHYGDPEKRPEDLCGMELVEFHSPYLM
jgi:ribonuclease BN (tRNA processing enzyme)